MLHNTMDMAVNRTANLLPSQDDVMKDMGQVINECCYEGKVQDVSYHYVPNEQE